MPERAVSVPERAVSVPERAVSVPERAVLVPQGLCLRCQGCVSVVKGLCDCFRVNPRQTWHGLCSLLSQSSRTTSLRIEPSRNAQLGVRVFWLKRLRQASDSAYSGSGISNPCTTSAYMRAIDACYDYTVYAGAAMAHKQTIDHVKSRCLARPPARPLPDDRSEGRVASWGSVMRPG